MALMQKNSDLIQVRNPYTDEILGELAATTPDEITLSIERAASAFRSSKLSSFTRFEILNRVAELLRDRKESFARSICSETGKPIRESRNEVSRACVTLNWSAQEALRIEGIIQPCDVTDQDLPMQAFVQRVPLGVIAALTPFNFPLNIPAHKIGPAVAAGNAVIIKPSPKAPLTVNAFLELFRQAGLPEDLLQAVHGGAEAARALVEGPVDAVSITGSTTAGREVSRFAAGKKLIMELGGNGPVVVMEDADLEKAAKTIVFHRFGSSGQRCTACKRAFIQESVYDEMRSRVLALAGNLKVGNPQDEDTDIGPLIDEESAVRLERRIAAAEARGALVITGGRREGKLIYPTLIERIRHDDPLVKEENFGPVLPLIRFRDFREVSEMVNSTPYGLQAAIFTNKMDIIQRAFREFDVGALVVNEGPGTRIESIPFGGVKASGIGREGVRYAVNEFTTFKTLIM